MTTTDSEIILAIDWLEQRSRFDDQARCHRVLDQAIATLKKHTVPIIADLGAGTGNHSVFMSRMLAPAFATVRMILVEQHAHLLSYAENQISQSNAPLDTTLANTTLANTTLANTTSANTTNVDSTTWQFVNADLHQWLADNNNNDSVDLLTNNALLDLLTITEINALIKSLARYQLPMYSTLNYQGVKFHPAHPLDLKIIALFEQHMCRTLDRGRPLGPQVNQQLNALICAEPTLRMTQAGSEWHICANTPSFLTLNLDFYEQGAFSSAASPAQKDTIKSWSNLRRDQIKAGQLEITVYHQDYLIYPTD